MIKITLKNIHLVLCAMLLVSCSTIASRQSYFAQVFDNSVHLMDCYVDSGKISKEVYFDEARKSTQEIVYKYNNIGELVMVDFVGDSSISGLNSEVIIKLLEDAIVQKKYLDSLKINIPLLPVNTSELSDICILLSTAKSIKSTVSGDLRILVVDSIGKVYRFNTSNLERFITPTDIVEKYTIILKDDIVVKEELVFDAGYLERKYIWINPKELNIEIEYRGKNNDRYSTLKKIVIDRAL